MADFTSSALIFFNIQTVIPNKMKHVKRKIDEHPAAHADVIQIHSTTEKTLKCININVFTRRLKLVEVNPRVLVATSVGTIGINSSFSR